MNTYGKFTKMPKKIQISNDSKKWKTLNLNTKSMIFAGITYSGLKEFQESSKNLNH